MTVIIIVISCSSIYTGTVLITLISLMTLSMNQPKVIWDSIGVMGIRIKFSKCTYDSHYYSHLMQFHLHRNCADNTDFSDDFEYESTKSHQGQHRCVGNKNIVL